MLSLLSLCVAVSTPASAPVQSPASVEIVERVPVVVAHGGDADLRDRLCRAGEVWFDAGEFLVGALDSEAIRALRLRGTDVTELAALAPTDELFVVDLSRTDVRADVDAAAAVLYQCDGQALVAVPVGLSQYPESLQPGRTCHSGHTALARRPMRPPTPPGGGAPRGGPAPAPGRALAPAVAAPAAGGGGPAALFAVDSRIQALVNAVSKANLDAWTHTYSTAWVNRDSQNLANFNAAKAQLIAQLQSYGYSPTTEQWNAAHGTNILVDIPGVKFPNRYVVFGSHFDTRNSSLGVNGLAPGADDNTSGSMGVLEIARLLSTAGAFENSIRLIWFAGEEYGLLGSNASAQAMLTQGKQVVGMLNMDMISYRAAGDVRDCDFCTNNTSASLNAFCMQTAPLYVPGWASTSGTLTAGSSDHASFTSAGFPAAFFFEDLSQYSPYIHTVNDVYPTSANDFDLAQMICRGVLACGATLAEPADLSIVHTPLPDTIDAYGPYLVNATITSVYGSTVTGATLHYSGDLGQSWQTAAMSANGSTWTGAIPAQGSPLEIWYWIEAVDDQNAYEYAPEGVDAGGAPYEFFVGTRTVIYTTGFEEVDAAGWTSGFTAGQNDWQRGQPFAKTGDPGAAYAGSKCWGNDLGPVGWNGAYANNVNNWLRSPVVNCSSASNVRVEFRRWLTIESGQYDQARVKVNGTTVWTNPSTGDLLDTAWMPISIDITALAAHNASVQIEFNLQSDGGVAFGGWNLDEFKLVEVGPGVSTCPPPAIYCTAKLNSQGCTPAIATAGTASATSLAPFDVTLTQAINQQNGLLFYGFAPIATPLHGGIKCVAAPVVRLPMMNAGGNVGPDDCSGAFSYDFNARIRSGVDPALIAGEDVYAQYWYRDPVSSSGIGMSNAVQFRICQ